MSEPLTDRQTEILKLIKELTEVSGYPPTRAEIATRMGFRSVNAAEQHLRALDKLQQLYPPALLQETLHIASLCKFSLDELRYEYPEEVVPAGYDANRYLRELVAQGSAVRWARGVPLEIQQRIDTELALIEELH